MTATRVAQWATGATGRKALGAVIDDPGLELVAVRVYDPDKVGRDAGELAGHTAIGVRATDELAAVLGAQPDVVLYMGSVESSPDECFCDVAQLLGAGVNVIATGSSFIDVNAFDPRHGDAIAHACRAGGSSFLGLGLFPGFWGEVVGPVLTRLSARCNSIVVREALSYAGYPSRQMLVDVMGYAQPPDSPAPLLANPDRARGAFIGTVSVLAKALGHPVDVAHAYRETAITPTDLHVSAGPIPAGTVAAMKLGLQADCGPMTIAVEHVTWLEESVAPQWSTRQGYEIEIGGAPTMRCNLVLGTDGEDHADMGCLATAMHAVHAIPFTVAAPPGVLDLADTAAFTGGNPWPPK